MAYVGIVISKKDLLEKGLLTVCPKDLDENDPHNWIGVRYTSFYVGGTYAGAVFLPETNSEILYDIAKNDPDKSYFFISCVMSPDTDTIQEEVLIKTGKDPKLGGKNAYPHDSNDGKYNNQSMSYGISTPLGHHLLMLEGRDEKSDLKGVRLASARGHAVVLDDSSDTQKVILKSKDQGASLKLTDIKSEDPVIGPEGSHLQSIQNTLIESMEGEMTLKVQDGRNIRILNKSTGSHADLVNRRSSFGSIEIISDRGDISIINKGNGIFIDCLGGPKPTGETGASFQVRSNNRIQLYAENGIDLKSLGDINIKGKNVNIQSDIAQGGTIHLNPTIPLDGLMGIRKTNQEIDYERLFGIFPFFFDPLWTPNYTVGPNTDLKLGEHL